MSECGKDELRILEAFTLGGNLAKEALRAEGGCDPKLQTRTERPRRQGPIGRRRPKRLKYASPSRRDWERKNALARKTLAASATPTTNNDVTEPGPAPKIGWLAGLKTSRGFPALLKKAMHVKPIGSPAEQELAATWSIRIVLPSRSALSLKALLHELASAWNWTRQQLKTRQTRKRLRVCETVSLGEKRLVALIEIDGEQFLVGGASGSLSTIARLDTSQTISEALEPRWARDAVQA